jgi:hypothetical protein
MPTNNQLVEEYSMSTGVIFEDSAVGGPRDEGVEVPYPRRSPIPFEEPHPLPVTYRRPPSKPRWGVATREDWDKYNQEVEEFEEWLNARPLDDPTDIRWTYPGVDLGELHEYQAKKERQKWAEEARIRREEWVKEMRPIWEADRVRDLNPEEPLTITLSVQKGEIRNLDTGDFEPGEPQRVSATITAYAPFGPDQAAQVDDQAAQVRARLDAPGPNPEDLPEYASLQDLRNRSESERDQLGNLEEELATAKAQYQNLSLTGIGVTNLLKKINGLEGKVEFLRKRAPLFADEIKKAESAYQSAREVLLTSHRERAREEAMAPVQAAKQEALLAIQDGLSKLLVEHGPALLLADQLGV